MSACTVSCFHSGLPYPEGKCAVCPDRREREAAEYKASIEINLQQSIAIGRLVQERDEARAEVTRWQAIATRAVEALDQSACCDGADEHEMSCSVGRVLELFDAAGSTTTLEIARAEDRAELLFHVVCLIRGEKDPLDVLLGHELSRRDERIAREAREAALNAAFAGVLDIVRTEHGCNPSTKSRLVVRLAVISGALAKKATP